MRANRIVLAVASAALALVMLFACLYWLPMVASRGANTLTDAVVAETDAETDKRLPSAKDVTVPEATAEYNFKSADFDSFAWTKTGAGKNNVTINRVSGVTIGSGSLNPDERAGYAVDNPLKGKVADGFSVMFVGTVDDYIFDYWPFLGFYSNDIDATKNNGNPKLFMVAGTGTDPHLNVNGLGNSGNNFYDITGGSVLDMKTLSRYTLTVDASAIKVYLNGELKRTLEWNATWSAKTYSFETVDFINEAKYFALGVAAPYWGNAKLTAQYVSFYNSALTADKIAAMNANLADFTDLNAAIAAAEEVDITNYNTKENGWEAAYAAFTAALDAARGMAWNASQTDIDNAETALVNATAPLSRFLREADLTDSLVAAYPLSAGGENLVGTGRGKVLFMNGTQTSDNLKLAKRQAIVGAKLYADENLADREMLDRSQTPTTGLKIPDDAFDGVSTSTGMTLTVSVYAYNFYRPYSRIFQLGTKASSGDGANGAQLYLMVTGGMQLANGSNIYVDNAVVGTYIAGEWITVSLVFTPDGTFRAYMTSNTSDRVTGGITSYEYTNKANVDTVLDAIIKGQDNWIGRSYWSADGNLVGLASNLSVYNRALSKAEVELLHHTKNLSELV